MDAKANSPSILRLTAEGFQHEVVPDPGPEVNPVLRSLLRSLALHNRGVHGISQYRARLCYLQQTGARPFPQIAKLTAADVDRLLTFPPARPGSASRRAFGRGLAVPSSHDRATVSKSHDSGPGRSGRWPTPTPATASSRLPAHVPAPRNFVRGGDLPEPVRGGEGK